VNHKDYPPSDEVWGGSWGVFDEQATEALSHWEKAKHHG
jgi:hypothetical protein